MSDPTQNQPAQAEAGAEPAQPEVSRVTIIVGADSTFANANITIGNVAGGDIIQNGVAVRGRERPAEDAE